MMYTDCNVFVPNAPKTMQEIAEHLGVSCHGDPNVSITGVGTLEHAKSSQISFLAEKKYRKFLGSTQASALILPKGLDLNLRVSHVVVDNPKLAYAKVAAFLFPQKNYPAGIHPSAQVSGQAKVHPSAYIGPGVVIGDGVSIEKGVVIQGGCHIQDGCQVGRYTRLHPNVVLYSNVELGEECILHSGVVIGGDGFGYVFDQNQWLKIPQLGSVIIGKRVEIGANTTIDRGTAEDTVIKDGVIIDNLVQIGHNVTIGQGTAIAGCAGIAGSTQIGRFCLIGGGSCINGHIQIVDHVHLSGGSMVVKSILEPGAYASVIPARPLQKWKRNVARFHQLEDMGHRLKRLEKKHCEPTSLQEES